MGGPAPSGLPLTYRSPGAQRRPRRTWWIWMLTSAAVGVVLGLISLRLRVNLIEGSVVNRAIVGTWVHSALLVATFPGLLLAIFAASDGGPPAYVLGLVVGQSATYGAAGLALCALWHAIRRLCRRR